MVATIFTIGKRNTIRPVTGDITWWPWWVHRHSNILKMKSGETVTNQPTSYCVLGPGKANYLRYHSFYRQKIYKHNLRDCTSFNKCALCIHK